MPAAGRGRARLIYFTDLECYHFGPEPEYPVLRAVTTDRSNHPWGEVIRVTVDR